MDTHEKPAGGGIPQAGCGIAADVANHSPFRARAEALTTTLRERWPHLFAEPVRPLAVGIFGSIAEALALDAAGLRALKAVLGRHTHRTAYLEAVIERRPRIDLNGNDAGAPEARHIEHAREALADKAARREAKAQAAANKAARIAASALRAQAKAQRKAAATLPAVPKPAPKPAPQARLLVARTKPTVIVRKRRRIEGGRR